MKRLVPKRRFAGFTDPWEQRKFEDVFVKLQNNSLSRAQLNYEEGIANNVHYGDILIKFGECLDVKREQLPYINNDISIDNYRASFLYNGDVIFADAAEDETVGKCSEIQGLTTQVVISGLHTIPCRPIQNFASGYLGYYLNSNAYHNQLLPLMQGTKVSSISKSSLNETYVIYPKSKEEQERIGTFFTNLDKLITLHQRKLGKLKATKSAYLSEMFPQDGELYPKRRFAGFTGPWERHKLGELAIYRNGKGYEDMQSGEGKYELINLNSISIDGGLKASGRFINEADETLMMNDLVMVLSDVAHGDLLGRVAIIPENYKFVLNQRVALLRPIEDVDSFFLFSYINSNQSYFKKQGAGSSQLNISRSSVENFMVRLPCIKEQEKIGSFFTNLESLITLQQEKLEKLQALKQAYLSEMFV